MGFEKLHFAFRVFDFHFFFFRVCPLVYAYLSFLVHKKKLSKDSKQQKRWIICQLLVQFGQFILVLVIAVCESCVIFG